jgi:hypothetical protein
MLLAGLGLGQAAGADSTLEYLVAEGGSKPGKLQPLVVKDGKVLAKGAGDGGNLDFIYSAAPEQLSIIDHRKHSVMTLDEAQVDRLAKQTEAVQPLLQGFAGQIAKLDPKQRAKWEEMLGGKISLDKIAEAARPTPQANIVKTGKARKVADIACEQMNVFQGKAQTAEFCLADPGKLKLSGEDYATLRSLLAFSGRLASKTQGLAKQFGVDIPPLDLRDLAGVPIELRDVSGHGQGSLRLNRVDASSVSAELMRVPDGYQSEPFKLWK